MGSNGGWGIAPHIWWWAVALIAIIVAVTLVIDMCLLAKGRPTISDYLRANPDMFIWPAALFFLCLVILAIHLSIGAE